MIMANDGDLALFRLNRIAPAVVFGLLVLLLFTPLGAAAGFAVGNDSAVGDDSAVADDSPVGGDSAPVVDAPLPPLEPGDARIDVTVQYPDGTTVTDVPTCIQYLGIVTGNEGPDELFGGGGGVDKLFGGGFGLVADSAVDLLDGGPGGLLHRRRGS